MCYRRDRFIDTLHNVVKGLNRAGFSDKDYRAIDAPSPGTATPPGRLAASNCPWVGSVRAGPVRTKASPVDDLDVSTVSPDWEAAATAAPRPPPGAGANERRRLDAGGASARRAFVADIKARALAENQAFEAKAQASRRRFTRAGRQDESPQGQRHLPREALAVRLPQFFIRVQSGGFFEDDQPFQLFEREELLKEFRLSQGDATISFDDVETEVYRVNLEQLGDENYAPRPSSWPHANGCSSRTICWACRATAR